MSARVLRPTCVERPFDACPTVRRGAIVETGEERQVPASGQIRIEAGRLDVAGDTLGERIGRGADGRAEQVDRARVRLDQPEHDAHQRGLARTVRTEQSMKAPWPHQQAHIGKHVAITVTLADAAHFDGQRR